MAIVGEDSEPQAGSRLWTLSARRLGAAPHRLMFFAGATNVILAMVWWAAWLIHSRWPGVVAVPYPPVFPRWLHAFVMQYQMLPSFIFGFLLTTFPKWTKQPEVTARRFVPVGVGLMGGQLATLSGALGSHTLILVGTALTLAGWSAALATLLPMVWREASTTWQARSCVGALLFGYAGLVIFGAFLLGASPSWVPASIELGSFGMLLPVFFTVAHRMFPFFAGNAVAGYQPWRPMWLLAAVWGAVLLHLVIALVGVTRWLWIPDAALAALTGIAWWRWWPRGAKPGLLVVLFVALAWLPIAMVLHTIDGVAYAASGAFHLGLAPAHALFIGFFGSALVAMVTRVTQGHSGRPLVMPGVAWFAFVAIQLVAVARIVADQTSDPWAWFAIAAVGWLIAFGPWIIRLGRIYLGPRADHKAG